MATVTEVIYYKNPNYGQPGEPEMLPAETVQHEVATQKRNCTRDEVIDLLPSGVMKACRDSTVAGVIKAFYKFLAKNGFTYAEGVVLGDGLEALSIITAQQNIDFKAAWPSA